MPSTKPLALVAEETQLGRWALTRALESDGFEVRAAADWLEASAHLAQAEFRLAILAVTSRRTNIAENIHSLTRYYPAMRVILLVDEDVSRETREACGPGVGIVSKPIDVNAIARLAREDGPARIAVGETA